MKLSALNDATGKAVDWWFIYKLPYNVEPLKGPSGGEKKTTGFEYLYFDSEAKGPLALSKNMLNQQAGALYQTIKPLYADDGSSNNSVGRIFYNDEIPDAKNNDEKKGHTKGVLAFNPEDDSAFWLLHSTPRFPLTDKADFPENEKDYGQTFLCVTLKDVKTASAIAEQMRRQQEPQTYGCEIPPSVSQGNPLYKLSQGVDVNDEDHPCDITFLSKEGKQFRLMAKNRHWGKDFWIDLVGPHLGMDLNVETWRRGTVPGTEDSGGKDDVQDVLYINLGPLGVEYEWHYTKDHAKWAASVGEDWVCVADINRQKSQEKRGGGTICFQNKQLWQGLSQIEKFKK